MLSVGVKYGRHKVLSRSGHEMSKVNKDKSSSMSGFEMSINGLANIMIPEREKCAKELSAGEMSIIPSDAGVLTAAEKKAFKRPLSVFDGKRLGLDAGEFARAKRAGLSAGEAKLAKQSGVIKSRDLTKSMSRNCSMRSLHRARRFSSCSSKMDAKRSSLKLTLHPHVSRSGERSKSQSRAGKSSSHISRSGRSLHPDRSRSGLSKSRSKSRSPQVEDPPMPEHVIDIAPEPHAMGIAAMHQMQQSEKLSGFCYLMVFIS